MEGDSWKRKTLNGEYGQAEGKDTSGGKAGSLCVGELNKNRGKHVTPKPRGSGSMGGF